MEAESALRRALAIRLETLPETNPLTQRVIKAFAELYDRSGKPAQAAAYRARLVPADKPAAAAK